jgi:hypothetical protein
VPLVGRGKRSAEDSILAYQNNYFYQFLRRNDMSYEIEFANRTYELDQICKPGGPRFILVDAPAGYGKSYLLRRVKETFGEWGNWVVVLVDLRSIPDMGSDEVGVARAAIANEVATQVGREEIANPQMDGGKVTFALNKLLQPMGQKFLLLFDGIEVLSAAASDWLRSMIGELDNALWTTRKELRVVLAGRYGKDWSQRTGFRLRLLELSPFDLAVVRPIVYDALARSQLAAQVDQVFVDALVTYTQWISGGHPQAICGIVSEIEKLEIVPPNLEFFFFSNVFQRDGRSGTMFDLYVEPIVEEILGESKVKGELETISVFRKFNPDILDLLIKDGEIHGFPDGWSLLQALMKTHLVDTPNLANPMYSDEIVRRMLAIRMRIKSLPRYERLNRRAGVIFNTWAQGERLEGIPEDGELDTQVRLVSIVESLYHALALMPHGIGQAGAQRTSIEQRNEDGIVEEIWQYREKMQKPDTVRRLMAALMEDQELEDLICSRAGERGYSRLLSTVESFVTKKVRADESSEQMPE